MTIITYPAPGEISGDTSSTDPSVGSVFLSEVRRCEGVITRASQGVIGVRVTDPALIPSKMGMNTVADDTVTLESASPDFVVCLELRLLSSEARSLAAILVRGADRVEFGNSPAEEAILLREELGRMGLTPSLTVT